MPWANPNDYVEAIQHPAQAFADPDLRGGTVTTTRLGLPRPISGNFATVFEVTCGERRWAVRCFLREVTDQQERYAAISAHLKRDPLPYQVNFEYLPQGIRVKGKWYPVLKMDWASGERLDTYVEAHLDDPSALRALADRWFTVCRSLRQHRIAHGDLQHGNILITGEGEIRLLDYDGMIVDEMFAAGKTELASPEIGHRHYQHPTRTGGAVPAEAFLNLDNFSAYVIGLSLVALSLDPGLWAQTKAGEENLLFRDVDYRDPGASAAFRLLAAHSDPRVRALADLMDAAVSAPDYLDVPPLEFHPFSSRVSQIREWLVTRATREINNLSSTPSPAPASPTATGEIAASSWLADHMDRIERSPLEALDALVAQERQRLTAEFERSLFAARPALRLPFMLVHASLRWSNYPLIIERRSAAERYQALTRALIAAKEHRKTLSRLIVEADRRYHAEIAALEAQIANCSFELERAQGQEAREVARIERILRALEQELAALPLRAGQIPGIDAAQIEALAWIGVGSAADITPANRPKIVREVGTAAWAALARWRQSHEQPGTPTAALPTSDDIAAVRARHAAAQRAIQQQQVDYADQLQRARTDSEHLDAVKRLRAELDDLERELETLQQKTTRANAEYARYVPVTLRRFVLLLVTAEWSLTR